MKRVTQAEQCRKALATNPPSVERLREVFTLAEDGRLFWRRSRGTSKRGSEAGYKTSRGYRHVKVDGVCLKSHRVVFAMSNDRWPSKEIDHVNCVRDDNRPENLREVTRSENQQNQSRAKNTNNSGLLGVSMRKDCRGFRASIVLHGKKTNIGTFATAEEAHFAYLKEKRKLHLAGAIAALKAPPLSPDELREYDRMRADEMARAEARRAPTPQLELEATSHE